MPSSADPADPADLAHPADRRDPVARALSRAAHWVGAAVRAVPTAASVVLIDGRSGSGKSSLARTVAREWPEGRPVQLLAMDSFYPGWSGLAAASDMVRDGILGPYARGEAGRWRRWDWAGDQPAEEHLVDPALPLIIEGAGALTPATAAMADVRVWLESPVASRRDRALERDGDTYRPHWDAWAAQEDVHRHENTPARWASHVFVVP